MATIVSALLVARAAGAAPFAYVPVVGSVTVIDTTTNTVVDHIAVEHVGGGVAVHPSGRRVYVTASDGVAVIDALANMLIGVIAAGTDVINVAVSPAGDRLYAVNASRDGTVTAIDTDSGSVVATITVGSYPFGIAVGTDRQEAYVTNTSDPTEHPPCSSQLLFDCTLTISIIDTTENDFSGRVTIGASLAGVTVDPISGFVFVAHQVPDFNALAMYGALAIIDPKTHVTRSDVRLGNRPYTFPRGVAVQPNGRRAYVTKQSGDVSVVDTTLGAEITSIPVSQPLDGVAYKPLDGIAFNPSGTRAYVVDITNGAVAVIDTATLTVVSTIPVGDAPSAFGQFVGPEFPQESPTPTPSIMPTPTTTPARCLGDCSGNNSVTVDEILTMVNIALGNGNISLCRAGDADGNSQIAINEVLTAVNRLLNGCGSI